MFFLKTILKHIWPLPFFQPLALVPNFMFCCCQPWMFSRVQDGWSVWRYKPPLVAFLRSSPLRLCSEQQSVPADLRARLAYHLTGNPAGTIPAPATSHSDNTDAYAKLQVLIPSITQPDHCLSRKLPSDPDREFFSDATEEAAPHTNALLSRFSQ